MHSPEAVGVNWIPTNSNKEYQRFDTQTPQVIPRSKQWLQTVCDLAASLPTSSKPASLNKPSVHRKSDFMSANQYEAL